MPVGIAFSWDWRSWRFGWMIPVKDNGAWAGPAEGERWLCLGPIALMFDE